MRNIRIDEPNSMRCRLFKKFCGGDGLKDFLSNFLHAVFCSWSRPLRRFRFTIAAPSGLSKMIFLAPSSPRSRCKSLRSLATFDLNHKSFDAARFQAARQFLSPAPSGRIVFGSDGHAFNECRDGIGKGGKEACRARRPASEPRRTLARQGRFDAFRDQGARARHSAGSGRAVRPRGGRSSVLSGQCPTCRRHLVSDRSGERPGCAHGASGKHPVPAHPVGRTAQALLDADI